MTVYETVASARKEVAEAYELARASPREDPAYVAPLVLPPHLQKLVEKPQKMLRPRHAM